MRDFTIHAFETLLVAIINNGYKIITYQQYAENKNQEGKYVILRHDIDNLPLNALLFATIEDRYLVKGTFYFRDTPEVFKKEILTDIASMGHEIGYHYEDLSKMTGNRQLAIKSFENSLNKFKSIYPVKTICMHGSPLSPIDNKQLWQSFNYNQFNLLAEIYLDTDFNKVFYLTDTGRNWNSRFNIRDRVRSPFKIPVKNTGHLVLLFNNQNLPDKIMINVHPQRWNNNNFKWTNELITQNIKNLFKYLLLKIGVIK